MVEVIYLSIVWMVQGILLHYLQKQERKSSFQSSGSRCPFQSRANTRGRITGEHEQIGFQVSGIPATACSLCLESSMVNGSSRKVLNPLQDQHKRSSCININQRLVLSIQDPNSHKRHRPSWPQIGLQMQANCLNICAWVRG